MEHNFKYVWNIPSVNNYMKKFNEIPRLERKRGKKEGRKERTNGGRKGSGGGRKAGRKGGRVEGRKIFLNSEDIL